MRSPQTQGAFESVWSRGLSAVPRQRRRQHRTPRAVGRWRRRAGQVAVEWLMIAGILTAVAIILTGMFQPVLVAMVRALARAVRTPGL